MSLEGGSGVCLARAIRQRRKPVWLADRKEKLEQKPHRASDGSSAGFSQRQVIDVNQIRELANLLHEWKRESADKSVALASSHLGSRKLDSPHSLSCRNHYMPGSIAYKVIETVEICSTVMTKLTLDKPQFCRMTKGNASEPFSADSQPQHISKCTGDSSALTTSEETRRAIITNSRGE